MKMSIFAITSIAALLALLACATVAHAAPDIVVADFEGATYGDWTTTGTAFGIGPAQGTLPGQQDVTGYAGHGLVNTFLGGDDSTGTLTSPRFPIARKFITFLVGGGDRPDVAYIALLIDGKIVRRTSDDNAERLGPKSWNVEKFMGQEASIEIVDNAKGGWGHINVDDIVQSDTPRGPVVETDKPLIAADRTMSISKTYVNIPIYDTGASRSTELIVDGKRVRRLDIRFADDGKGTRSYFYDVSQFKGKSLTFKVDRLPEDSQALASITQTDAIADADRVYKEDLRPLFHFTTRRGWINDPNGLVYFQGEYHLFYQHDPLSTRGGNKHWGHAVSKDLFHWKELPTAIYPGINSSGNPFDIWSGSALVDWHNTSGFQTGKEPPLVAFYTAAGNPFEQHAAYSNDRGRTFTEYAGNPVIPHIIGGDRDPKATWDEDAKLWVLALFLDKNDYALFTSPDLKNWTRLDGVVHVGNDGECPDFYKINLDGDPAKPVWVFSAASGHYVTGSFDGQKFTYDEKWHAVDYGASYAVQTYSDIPKTDGRRIQIGWLTRDFPDMPFNQQLSIPCQLTLRSTPDGPRLFKYPVKEIEALYDKAFSLNNVSVKPGENPLSGLTGPALDIDTQIEIGSATEIDFSFRGATVRCFVTQNQLRGPSGSGPLPIEGGLVKLHIVVDRASVEVFANDGQVAISSPVIPGSGQPDAVLSVTGGTANIVALSAHTLKSIWR